MLLWLHIPLVLPGLSIWTACRLRFNRSNNATTAPQSVVPRPPSFACVLDVSFACRCPSLPATSFPAVGCMLLLQAWAKQENLISQGGQQVLRRCRPLTCQLGVHQQRHAVIRPGRRGNTWLSPKRILTAVQRHHRADVAEPFSCACFCDSTGTCRLRR